jgi:hypothetical protein
VCWRFSLPEADVLYRALIVVSLVLLSAACGVRSDHRSASLEDPGASRRTAPILVFNGTGASPDDVEAIEAILKNNHLSYSTATSSQLNDMGQSPIRRYRLLIVPGGNFVEMGNSLTPNATATYAKR